MALPASAGVVDRATARRDDPAWLEAAWADPRTRVLVIEDGRVLVRFSGDGPAPGGDGADLVFLAPARAPDGLRFLLGIGRDQVAYFGVAGPLRSAGEAAAGEAAAGEAAAGEAAARDGVRPATLRQAGPLLPERDTGLMTHAIALANWHATHTHCPRCGTPTEPALAGHSRRCPADGSEHFPRTDPAVIMLVTDPDDRCLLARNAQWPQRRVSILAGFVEPGEFAEQAVAREVLEETGVTIGEIRYVGSQPWPMPHSLMLGFRARAAGGQQITVDNTEIAEARWFSRDQLRASLADGAVLLPPPVSIAYRIIASWYGASLAGAS